MEQFFRNLGFRIADDPTLAIVIGLLCIIGGVALAVRAWRDHEDLGDHRFFTVVCGLGLAATIAVTIPLLHRMAENACDRWDRSPEAVDTLAFVEHRCADRF